MYIVKVSGIFDTLYVEKPGIISPAMTSNIENAYEFESKKKATQMAKQFPLTGEVVDLNASSEAPKEPVPEPKRLSIRELFKKKKRPE